MVLRSGCGRTTSLQGLPALNPADAPPPVRPPQPYQVRRADKAGTGQHCQMVRVRQARRKGIREEPAAESLSRRIHQLESGRSGLVVVARTRDTLSRGTPWLGDVAGQEAVVKVCGVAAAMLQGHSWVPIPSNGLKVNVGTIPVVPNPGRCQLPGESQVGATQKRVEFWGVVATGVVSCRLRAV